MNKRCSQYMSPFREVEKNDCWIPKNTMIQRQLMQIVYNEVLSCCLRQPLQKITDQKLQIVLFLSSRDDRCKKTVPSNAAFSELLVVIYEYGKFTSCLERQDDLSIDINLFIRRSCQRGNIIILNIYMYYLIYRKQKALGN